MNKREMIISGPAAVRARFQRDPDSILRLFFDAPTARRIGVMCKALAVRRRVYRCIEPDELEAVSGTVHHGGIVAVVTAPELVSPSAAEIAAWVKRRSPVLLLDRIGNPHNLGAIARTAAFFGVEQLVLPASPEAAMPGEAAYRVAEGGLERVAVWRVFALKSFAKELMLAGYTTIGAATRGGKPPVSDAAMDARPIALALGNEEQGLAPDLAAMCSLQVTLPSRGEVESLNVSVAAAVLMWEYFGRPRK